MVIPKQGIFNGNLAESMVFNGYLWDLMVTLWNLASLVAQLVKNLPEMWETWV